MSTDTNDDRSERRDRPRIGVLGYGSLLQPAELATLSEDAPARAIPVRVDGMKRVLDQRTSRRTDDEVECAVANVVRSDDSWINGVLLPDVGRREFEAFRERERWYRLIEVPADDVEPYDEDERSLVERQDLVLTTTGLETEAGIEPIPAYVDARLDGATEWGQGFREDFLATTETNAGDRLTEYDDRTTTTGSCSPACPTSSPFPHGAANVLL